eukprot:687630-Alexandrium_andersonii.AAC.1
MLCAVNRCPSASLRPRRKLRGSLGSVGPPVALLPRLGQFGRVPGRPPRVGDAGGVRIVLSFEAGRQETLPPLGANKASSRPVGGPTLPAPPATAWAAQNALTTGRAHAATIRKNKPPGAQVRARRAQRQ